MNHISPAVPGGRRTPAVLYRLISHPLLRAVLGNDRPRRDFALLPCTEPMSCLEVGSGGGFYTAALKSRLGAGSRLVALDPDADSLQSLAVRLDGQPGAALSCVTGSACAIPLPDAAVDAVFFGFSLEETEDPLQAVHEAHRVLRPGGYLLVFLWRPAMTRTRRHPVLARLADLFEPRSQVHGPQNLRLLYQRSADPTVGHRLPKRLYTR